MIPKRSRVVAAPVSTQPLPPSATAATLATPAVKANADVALLDSTSATLLFDPLVLAVGAALECVVEEHESRLSSGAASLELEARLGAICIPESTDRIRLPVRSEAQMVPTSLFQYFFQSEVPAAALETTRRFLETTLRVLTPKAPQVKVSPNDPTFIQTEDEIRSVPPTFLEMCGVPAADGGQQTSSFAPSARVSYPAHRPSLNAKPLEVIHKARQRVIDVYTGSAAADNVFFPEEAQQQLDFRVAVNLEYKLSKFPPGEIISTRRRERVSYPIGGRLRVDSTRVTSDTGRGADDAQPAKWELEVEANGQLLVEEAIKKRRGDPHLLYHLVHEFLGVVRAITKLLNGNNAAAGSTAAAQSSANVLTVSGGGQHRGAHRKRICELAQLEEVAVGEDALERYLTYVSPVVPIIGDYLFRAVARDREGAKAAVLTDTDIQSARRLEPTAQELQILKAVRNPTGAALAL